MIRKILKSKWSLVILIVAWLVLIWSRTFIGMANGCGITVFEILGKCSLTVFLTIMWGCSLYAWDDEIGLFYKDDETDRSIPVSSGGNNEETDSKEAELEEVDLEQTAFGETEHEDVAPTETKILKIADASEENEKSDTVESLFMKWLETEDPDSESVHSSGLRNSLCVVLTLTVICMLSFALSDWTDWLDFFSDSTYMQIGWFCVNKKYLYDVLAVIIFPLWTTFIIRKLKESKFTAGAVFSGIMQILALTLIDFLLYMGKPNIWLIEMAVLNVITLVLAVRGYVWKNIWKKGNAVALLIVYALFWIGLISIFYHSGQSVFGFMGFTDTTQATSYFTNVHKIAENASFVGQNSAMLNDPYVLSFMKDSHYLIPSVLFYGGWLPTMLLMLAEVVFLVAMAGVSVQAREHDGRDIMLDMIWIEFLIRVVAGLLYSFGLPTPILLPFAGTTGIITDSICMGMLLVGYANKKWNIWCEGWEEDFMEDWEDDEYEDDDE